MSRFNVIGRESRRCLSPFHQYFLATPHFISILCSLWSFGEHEGVAAVVSLLPSSAGGLSEMKMISQH